MQQFCARCKRFTEDTIVKLWEGGRFGMACSPGDIAKLAIRSSSPRN